MKQEFHAHPFMMLKLMKPFRFVLILPVLKGLLQYWISRKITGVLGLEIVAVSVITLIAALRCRSFRLIISKQNVTVQIGVILRSRAVIPIEKLSSVRAMQNPLDAVFHAVTMQIHTEAGLQGRADFEYKLRFRDSERFAELIYGNVERTTVKFSAIKVAIMAATTSSAVTGMIIAVPVIHQTGRLLGLAIDRMLLDEINTVSERFQTVFPPIVNAVTLIFLLSYAVAFVYSLLKTINFTLATDETTMEVKSGFFVRRRAFFKKSSVNDVKIDQTPLMRLFRRYVMKVSVGGYGDTRSEEAVLVPSARRNEIQQQFSTFFPFLKADGPAIHAAPDGRTLNRFLFWPKLYMTALFTVSVIPAVFFEEFRSLILFLNLVTAVIIVYHAYLCVFEWKFGSVKFGDNLAAKSVKGFRTTELYCPKENIGEIKIMRFPPDLRRGTCSIRATVRSEAADHIRVRHIDYAAVCQGIAEIYGIRL